VKIIQQTPAELELRDGPVKTVLMGGLFIAVGGGAVTLWLTHPTGWKGNGGPWVIYIVGGVFVAVGILLLALSADRRYVIDRATRTARFVVRRLMHSTSTEYPLGDIEDVALERSGGVSGDQSRQGTGGSYYRIVFLTRSGGRVPWTPFSTGDEGTLASCVAAVRAFCGWRGSPQEASSDAPPPVPTAPTARPVNIKWGWVGGFLGIFVAVGLGLFGLEVYRVATWQQVTARVLSVGIREVHNDNGATYAPVVQYQYLVGGTWYVSDRVLPITVSASRRWAERMRDRFRPGDLVPAYVNPDKPASAYLVREVSLLPLLFVALPLAMAALLAWFTRLYRRQLEAVRRNPVPMVEARA